MTYTVLAVSAVAIAALLDLVVLRTRLLVKKTFWLAYAIMFCFQLLVNGILTGLPVVSYDHDTIVGLRIAHAPVEDLLFGFALILSTLVSWVRLTDGADREPVR